MQIHQLQASRRTFMRPLVLGLSSAFAVGAWAQDEPSPYYIGVTQGFTHDTNIYGSSTNQISDTYSSTGLKAGLDQIIGRQRLYASANVRYNKYRQESALDNTSYGVAAGWDWATINDLAGTLGANANQHLANLDTTAGVQNTNEKNLLKTDQVNASINWGGARALNLNGAYAHSRVSYSAPSYVGLESSADSASGGFHYRVGPELRLGAAVRYVRTESPNGYSVPATNPQSYEPNTANIRNLDLTADWRVTALTGLDTRLSWTRLTNSNANLSALDFSGLTGRVGARYAVTGKTTLTASLSRDVGSNATFFNNPTASPAGSPQSSGTNLTHNSQTTDTFALGVKYAATAKISVDLDGSYRRAKIVYDAGSTLTDANDDIRSVGLGVDYAIARNWSLGCTFDHSSRSVSGTSSSSYTENRVGCTAQLTLR
jgi:hypothetical protein